MDTLAWFFFKLLVFGYVEDLGTGIAFQLPGGLHWKICVEVNLRVIYCSVHFIQNCIGIAEVPGYFNIECFFIVFGTLFLVLELVVLSPLHTYVQIGMGEIKLILRMTINLLKVYFFRSGAENHIK